MTPEERALRDAWVAEMWPVCLEVPREERARKFQRDRLRQQEMVDDAQASPAQSPTIPQVDAQTAA